MGEFKKDVLKQFIENECDRQLFINLAKGDPEWMSPVVEIAKLESIRRGPPSQAAKFGKIYEQLVYQNLRNLPNTKYSVSTANEVVFRNINKEILDTIFEEINNTGETQIHLESGLETPISYYKMIFGVLSSGKIPSIKKTENIFPDILVFSKGRAKYQLNLDGSYSPLSDEDIKNKIGINIIDIKKTHEENVGKKLFIEIIFYATAIRYYLEENNLTDKFYVNIENNGIFPGLDNIFITNIDNLFSKLVIVVWKEIYRLFDKLISKVESIWVKCPISIDTLETNISTSCGRCSYYDDCVNREGGNPKDPNYDPNNMSVKLLPYTSNSTAEQLGEYGIKTIGDLVKKIDQISIGYIPKPIYAELPKLRLKGKSLSSKKVIQPSKGELISMSIPKFSESTIIINLEEDPLHGRVFGFGLSLNISVTPSSPYFQKFERWWKLWKNMLDGNLDLIEMGNSLEARLKARLSRTEIKEIAKILKILERAGAKLRYFGKPFANYKGDMIKSKSTSYYLDLAVVNEGLSTMDEFELTKVLVTMSYYFIRLSTYIEQTIYEVKMDKNGKEFLVFPSTAIFYWSQEILDILENLIQRQLTNLMREKDLNYILSYLVNWFTPSESMIKQSDQMRKIFDLRQFVETTQGLPQTINYTWHGVHELNTGNYANKNFFSKHFNYMDHNVWYGFLLAKESSAAVLAGEHKSKSKHREDIIKQLIYKIRTINSLKNKFQKDARNLISRRNTKPVRSQEIDVPKVPSTYHDIARIWFLYSRLTGAYSEQEADNFRFMYPQYSIGKLASAAVSNLSFTSSVGPRGGNKYVYSFDLQGLSSNMKLKEKSRVLLLPEEMRDFLGTSRSWTVTVDTLIWDSSNNSIVVITEPIGKNLEELYKYKMETEEKPNAWYLYPVGGEYWTNKLDKMLLLNNMGVSWLGKRLSYLWEINPELKDEAPNQVLLQEVYMYHPRLLDNVPLPNHDTLLTKVKLPPNPSQRRAILNSMNKVISSIQGPPGTGKSQTIVALIDEFIRKHNKPPRILITSFSYQALNVLVDKIAESVMADDAPSPVAIIPRVYLHSSSKPDHSRANNLVKSSSWKLNGESGIAKKGNSLDTEFPEGFIIFGVAHQLFRLSERKKNGDYYCISDEFAFDLIIVDEASQMPVDQLLASLMFINKSPVTLFNLPTKEELMASDKLEMINAEVKNKENLTKLIFVGDYNQLPPVQPIKPPIKLERILGSLFTYYIINHEISNVQLEINYRSHDIIVEYTRRLGFYNNLSAFSGNANTLLLGNFYILSSSWITEIMDPTKVVSTLIHNHNFETAISMIEAQITTKLILAYYEMVNPQTEKDEEKFFLEQIGVVAPHNAHGRLIIRMVYEELNINYQPNLNDNDLMNALQQTIFSVEKFQGSDRNFIIGSIGISSFDQLSAEEEFIYEINRFNVLTSRAKNKMILICSNNFLEYFPEQRDVISNASKITDFAYEFCNKSIVLDIPCNEHKINEQIELRFRDKV